VCDISSLRVKQITLIHMYKF